MRDGEQKNQWGSDSSNPASKKEKAEGSRENVNPPGSSRDGANQEPAGFGTGHDERIPEEISHTGQGADNRSRGSDSSIADEQQSRQNTGGISNRTLNEERENQEAVPPRGVERDEI